MVGEIRDAETAQIAVQSALTGHLVFTTVHANNAFDVLGRFLNMGIEPYNFVSYSTGILAQRLVRILCPRCKSRSNSREMTRGTAMTTKIQGPAVLRCRGVQGLQLHRLPGRKPSRNSLTFGPDPRDDHRKTAVVEIRNDRYSRKA